jgi:hypothetical protein
LLGSQVRHALSRKAVDAVALQRVRGVQHPLHRRLTVAVLALGDEALGEVAVVGHRPE